MVVNALWAAGADAISVNGQRIGPDTFVRTAGSVILVNVTPVSSALRVSAIGDSNACLSRLVRGATGGLPVGGAVSDRYDRLLESL